MEEKKKKPKQKKIWTEDIVVNKIEAEVTDKETRLRFHTVDHGEITYRPKKEVKRVEEVKGLEVINREIRYMKPDEVLNENDWFQELVNNVKKSRKEIIQSCYNLLQSDNDPNIWYGYFNSKDFESIYYEKFHKDNTDRLTAQHEARKKYEENRKGEEL